MSQTYHHGLLWCLWVSCYVEAVAKQEHGRVLACMETEMATSTRRPVPPKTAVLGQKKRGAAPARVAPPAPPPAPPAAPPPPVVDDLHIPPPRPEYVEFGQTVLRALLMKGWNQSDLAKAMWGTTVDSRGYKVARNRDRITHYVKGRAYPEPENLAKLVHHLGLRMEDVAVSKPVRGAVRTQHTAHNLQVTMLAAEPGKALLYMQKVLPTDLAMAICKMIVDAEAAAAALGDPIDPAIIETEEP